LVKRAGRLASGPRPPRSKRARGELPEGWWPTRPSAAPAPACPTTTPATSSILDADRAREMPPCRVRRPWRVTVVTGRRRQGQALASWCTFTTHLPLTRGSGKGSKPLRGKVCDQQLDGLPSCVPVLELVLPLPGLIRGGMLFEVEQANGPAAGLSTVGVESVAGGVPAWRGRPGLSAAMLRATQWHRGTDAPVRKGREHEGSEAEWVTDNQATAPRPASPSSGLSCAHRPAPARPATGARKYACFGTRSSV